MNIGGFPQGSIDISRPLIRKEDSLDYRMKRLCPLAMFPGGWQSFQALPGKTQSSIWKQSELRMVTIF